MNKGERNRKTLLVFLRRLRNMNMLSKSGQPKRNQYCFKSQGKPCSCFVCSSKKYKREIKHKNKLYED